MSRRASLLLAIPPLAFVGLFFVWPLLGILRLGLGASAESPLTIVGRVWTDPHVVDVLVFTAGLAIVSTVLTVVLGLPAAWVFARFDFPGRRLLRALTVVPFVLPTVVVGAAFLALLGPRSPLNALATGLLGDGAPQVRLDGSVGAILVAHVFYNLAVVVRVVGSTWERLDPRVEEAARMLSASPARTFREITWPRLLPSVLSAASIVLLFTATSFGVVLLLGGPRDTTLEVEIYRQAAVRLDLPTAAALTLIQLVGVGALLLVSARAQERAATRQQMRAEAGVVRRPRTRTERILVGTILALLVTFIVAPLIVLVERSFAGPGGYGLSAWQALLVEERRTRLPGAPAEAVVDSLAFAVVATAVAATLGLCAAVAAASRRGWLSRSLDALVTLPLGISAVIVGFGFLVALDLGPFDLRTSIILIPLAHALIALPFVLRVVAPIARSIDPRLREAATVLGASPARAWRFVDAPILARGAAVGAGFAFAVSLGEFGATLFIARPESTTIPVAIYRLLGQPGAANFATAMALSTLLMLITVVVMLLVDRVRVPGASADLMTEADGPHGAVAVDTLRPLLEVSGLRVAYGATEVLRGVDLSVADGSLVCVLGPSGSGKTTLLRAIAGLETPTAGTIRMLGRDLAAVPPHERGVGLMFQDYALFPNRDVAGNVAFGLRMAGEPDAAIRARLAEVLALVGLEGLGSRRVEQLSGGEQQRVALARALAPRPRLLMLDEPMGSLDRTLRERLPEELRTLFRSLGLAALYVTHDQDEALSVADRVLILDDGRVVADGTPEALWSRPPSAWVARFLGFRNVAAAVIGRDGAVATPWGRIVRPRAGRATDPAPGIPHEGRVSVVLRASSLRPDPGGPISGTVTSRRFGGDHVLLGIAIADAPLLHVEARWATLPAIGDAITLGVEADGLHVIASDGRVGSVGD